MQNAMFEFWRTYNAIEKDLNGLKRTGDQKETKRPNRIGWITFSLSFTIQWILRITIVKLYLAFLQIELD